jgi:tetratricopeptide (TPR) repeat protein
MEVSSMSETDFAQEPQSDDVSSRRAVRRPGMFDDPVVRTMAYVAGGLVILFLVAIVSVMITGVVGAGSNRGPRTLAEKNLLVSGTEVANGTADVNVWSEYISSLIGVGEYGRARRAIEDGRSVVDDSIGADFTLAEARLLSAQGKYTEAIAAADKAMTQMQESYDGRIAAGGESARVANLDGLSDNFGVAILIKAYAYRDLGEWDQAIEQYDTYLKDDSTAADILIDRGNAHIKVGNEDAAEKDFRAALKFIPNSAEAIAGLDAIGAKR